MKTRIIVIMIFIVLSNLQFTSGITLINNDSLITSFSENILLSTVDFPYSHHVEPTLAISETDGTLFAGWKNAYSHNGPGVRVSFSKSTNGKSWSEPFDMPMFENINTGQSDPWLVWHDDTLYYAYLEYSMDTNELSQITVAKSTDSGETWRPVAASYGDGFADKETMTVSSNGTIYVTYDDINYDKNCTTVRLTRSTDKGKTFHEIGVITDSISQPESHLGPYVITDSKNDVYVAWIWFSNEVWGDVYVVGSKDQGETFSEEIDINPESENATFENTSDESPSQASLPVLKFDNNNRLYALWAERFESDGAWDVYMKYSDDYGLNWSERYQVNPDIAYDQWQPDMDIDSKNRCHIVWYDEHEDTFRPYYRLITFPEDSTGEISYGDPIAIASANTSSSFTRPGDYFTIRVDSNDIPHVVWTDGREGEMDIYYSHGISDSTVTTSTTSAVTFTGLWILIPIFIALLRKKR
ncbi:MAG: sialidase family protein [Promethearchaeota archaeon]